MLETIFYKLSSYIQLAFCSLSSLSCASAAEQPSLLTLNLPAGFEINIFAKLEAMPRMLAFDKSGNLFVTLSESNQLVMLPDANKDGVSETGVLVSDALNSPNGLAFIGDDLLVANQDGVVKLSKKKNGLSARLYLNFPAAVILLKPLNWGQIIICILMWGLAAMCA